MKNIAAYAVAISICGISICLYAGEDARGPVSISKPGAPGTARIVFSADGAHFATAPDGDGAFRLWDMKTLSVKKVLDGTKGLLKYAIAFSPDGRIVAGGVGDEIVVWDAASGRQVRRFTGHRDARIYSLSFTPDGRRLVSVGCDADAGARGRVWSTAEWSLLRVLGYDFNDPCATASAISPDGQQVIIGGGSDGAADHPALVYEIESGKKVRDIIVVKKSEDFFQDAMIRDICCTPDGKRVFAIMQGFVKGFDAGSGRELFRINADKKAGQAYRRLCCAPDGAFVAALLRASSRDWRVVIIDARDGSIARTFTADGGRCYYYNLAFTPDGKHLALVGTKPTIDFYDWK